MAFQRFTESGKGYRPKISLRPSGTIGINDSALKKFGLIEYDFIALYFDPESKRIAIGGAQEQEAGSQRLNKGNRGASISAKRFLDFHDISVSRVTQFECHLDIEQNLVVLDKEIERSSAKRLG
jgi:hypothetical protein